MSVLLLSLLLVGPPTSATESVPAAVSQGAVRRVPAGDPQRQALLDTLRPAIEARIGQPVQFVVDKLQTQGDWAFYAGRIQQPNGRPIDFATTPYAELIDEGVFDGPSTYALLQRTGGRWRLVDWVVGPTDVYYLGWPATEGAPESLFE